MGAESVLVVPESRPREAVKTVPADVAVNLLWCVPGDVGGSEEYLVRQLLGLVEASAWRPRLYVPDGFAVAHPRLAHELPIVVAPFDCRSRPRRIVGETMWFRRRSGGAALRHHGGGVAPLAAKRPYVLTVHDLQYRRFPEYFRRSKRWYFDAMIGRSVRGAAAVAVPSEYVRRSVIDAYGIDAGRAVVVPHGIEPDLVADATPADELRRRYALSDGPIIVYPAVTHPHKNHRFLVEMMRTRWRDDDLRLVLTGGSGSAEGDVTVADDPRIRRLGRVPDADRNGLLRIADAMVFPSTYEGFGAPLIEAMALGCPVVASNATCIPDVVGDAGLVLPLQAEQWSRALDTVRRNRDRFVTAGRERATQFTARASGQALAAVYDAALENE
jgi:glycosyltransferase involved in cell wall biosynthesis